MTPLRFLVIGLLVHPPFPGSNGGEGVGSVPRAMPAARADSVPRYVVSALSLYRAHPDTDHVRRLLGRWTEDGGAVTPLDSVAAAMLWRRADQYRSALDALPSERDARGALRPRVALERARILLQAPPSGPGVPGTPEQRRLEGGAAFRLSCGAMDGETRQALWTDLRGLLTPDEQEDWSRREAGPAACREVRRIIEERAYRMGIDPDERLEIHYRRLHEARDLYYLRTPRLTDDLADRLGRADSLEIDDRGLIYLRMGKPLATVAPFMGLNETWAYARPGGPRVFHFAPVSKTGLRALGDYRLLENLAHASGFTMPSELMSAGGARFAYLYQARRVLDFLYRDPRFRQMDTRMRAAGDRFNPGFQGFLAWERDLNEADARFAVSGIPDAPLVSPAIELVYETLRFREAGSGRSEVWFLAATRAGDLTARPAGDPGAAPAPDAGVSYHVEGRLAWLAPDGMGRLDRTARPRLADPLAADDGIALRWSVSLDPGAYPYSLTVRDAGAESGSTGNWALDTVLVPARPADLPSTSDIAVAPDSGGTWSRDGRIWLPVSPTHVLPGDGIAHIYFEVYGIRPGKAYEVEVRVAPDSAAVGAFAMDPSELAFALRFPSVAERDRSGAGIGRQHLRVDLGASPPGAYRLAVRVTDLESGIASLPAVTPLYRTQERGAHWMQAPRRRSTIVNP